MEWYWILLIVLGSLAVLALLSILLYKQFFKRFYDIVFSCLAIIILSPLLIILSISGAIAMRGNPFFVQDRPGKKEKIFKLIKFRSMSFKKDKEGNLLSDEDRLSNYGKFIRKTSLDELPELFNILVGTMSFVGPRPLLTEYLPYYSEREKHRHDVRPGLTGLAQVNGRNNLNWNKRLEYDCNYVESVSFFGDLLIVFKSAVKVISRSDVAVDTHSEGNLAKIRKREQKQ